MGESHCRPSRMIGLILAATVPVFGGCRREVTAAPPVAVARIQVLRPSGNWGGLIVGATMTFFAVAYDDQGAVVQGAPPPAWVSRDTNVATVNASGVVQAIAGGTATIVASTPCTTGVCADSIPFVVSTLLAARAGPGH